MRDQTNLVRRGSVFYFRKRVPKDLLGSDSLPTSGVVRQSLGEGLTKAQARTRAAELAHQWETRFASIRGRGAHPSTTGADGCGHGTVHLSTAIVPAIADAWLAHMLRADEEARAAGLSDDIFEWRSKWIEADLQEARNAYARGLSEPVRRALSDWLPAQGIDPETITPDLMKALERECVKARLKALEGSKKRNLGELVETPAAPDIAAATKGASGPRLEDLLAYWQRARAKSERSIAAAATVAREFEKVNGSLPLSSITKAHWVALRDAMLGRVTPATVQARFNLVKAAYNVALEDDQCGITANPLQHVKIRRSGDESKSRDAFTVDQLQTIFGADIFTNGERPEGGRGEAAYWAPLLALFTGARLDEVLSLRIDGVYRHEGVPVIHFRHRPELGQRLKGKHKNARRVPVHPELVRLGFLAYAGTSKGRGDWLFPDIDRSAKRRSHSSAWGAWFGRWLGRLGIKTKAVTFHSFRHTFKHFARASGVPEDHHDAITGHTTAEVSRRYGSCEGYPIGPLSESMQRLRFGSLRIGHG